MARSIPSRAVTPADELRRLLDESEKRAVGVRNAGPADTRELLDWLDRIHRLFPELEAGGVDLAPERGRWQAVQGTVRRHSASIRRELASLGGLRALRSKGETLPDRAQWWWWLDEIARETNRKRVRSLIIALVVIAGLLLGGRWLMNRFFPVDPLVIEALNETAAGERALQEGDIETAITHYEAARTAVPDDYNTLAWLVGLYDLGGRADAAAAATADLLKITDESRAYANLADVYTRLGQAQRGLELAQTAIAANPDNPQAYLARGGAYESMRQFGPAIQSYDKAATVAEAQNNAELQAIARIRMGQLLQSGPGLLPDAEPTP